jgi:hypothetical protein
MGNQHAVLQLGQKIRQHAAQLFACRRPIIGDAVDGDAGFVQRPARQDQAMPRAVKANLRTFQADPAKAQDVVAQRLPVACAQARRGNKVVCPQTLAQLLLLMTGTQREQELEGGAQCLRPVLAQQLSGSRSAQPGQGTGFTDPGSEGMDARQVDNRQQAMALDFEVALVLAFADHHQLPEEAQRRRDGTGVGDQMDEQGLVPRAVAGDLPAQGATQLLIPVNDPEIEQIGSKARHRRSRRKARAADHGASRPG